MIADARLRILRDGRIVRIPRSSIEDYIDNHLTEAALGQEPPEKSKAITRRRAGEALFTYSSGPLIAIEPSEERRAHRRSRSRIGAS